MTLFRKQELCFDAINLSFFIIRSSYERVLVHCMSEQMSSQASCDLMVMDAWTVIDGAKRLRSILEKTPGLKSTPSLRLFLSGTEHIPSFRHYIQHLDEKLGETAISGRPIWGSFSWSYADQSSNTFKIRLYVPGRIAKTKGIPLVNPLGKPHHGPVDHFTITVGDESISVSDLVRSVQAFESAFNAALAGSKLHKLPNGEELLQLEIGS